MPSNVDQTSILIVEDDETMQQTLTYNPPAECPAVLDVVAADPACLDRGDAGRLDRDPVAGGDVVPVFGAGPVRRARPHLAGASRQGRFAQAVGGPAADRRVRESEPEQDQTDEEQQGDGSADQEGPEQGQGDAAHQQVKRGKRDCQPQEL